MTLGSPKPQEPTWGAPQFSNAVSLVTFQGPQNLIWGPSRSLTQFLFLHTNSSKSHPPCGPTWPSTELPRTRSQAGHMMNTLAEDAMGECPPSSTPKALWYLPCSGLLSLVCLVFSPLHPKAPPHLPPLLTYVLEVSVLAVCSLHGHFFRSSICPAGRWPGCTILLDDIWFDDGVC